MEVVPVPTDYLPQVWPAASRVCHWYGNECDTERLHQRLLVGRDLLWLALNDGPPRRLRQDHALAQYDLLAVIVTAITERPPTKQQRFRTKDPAAARSLSVHLVNGIKIQSWIESAVERITRYGLENHCRQLFLMSCKGWQHYALQFGEGFDRVAFSRDRPTALGLTRLRQHPGFYREVNPQAPHWVALEVLPTTPARNTRQGDSEFYRQLQARRKKHGPQKFVEVPCVSLESRSELHSAAAADAAGPRHAGAGPGPAEQHGVGRPEFAQ